jgi:hypothetical protein
MEVEIARANRAVAENVRDIDLLTVFQPKPTGELLCS